MKIKLKRCDEKIPLIEQPARKIIDYILHGRNEMFQVFSDTLLSCSKYTGNNFLNNRIMKSIEMQKGLYPQLDHELEYLKNLMWDYFSYVDDFELNSLLKVNSGYYNNISSEQQKLNKLRGVLFEMLVEEIISIRYINDIFDTGCMVIINGKKVISYYEGISRQTIDIAGSKDTEGEFYECKLSPNSLDAKSYKYLDLLEQRLSKDSGFRNVVGCVSLGARETIENAKEQIEQDLESYNENIMLYGRDEILLLIDSPFNEAI